MAKMKGMKGAMMPSQNRNPTGFGIKDGTQAGTVRPIQINAEQYNMGKVQKYQGGTRGYCSEAQQSGY